MLVLQLVQLLIFIGEKTSDDNGLVNNHYSKKGIEFWKEKLRNEFLLLGVRYV